MSEITLHPSQSEVFEDLFVNKCVRHAVVVASRGWGKSWFAGCCAIQAVFELLELHRNVPNKNVYIIAPTYDQVTDIYFPMLAYQMGLERYAVKCSRDAGTFTFAKDVTLRLVSYEAVERIRGKGAYFIVNDEVSSWKKGIGLKEAWESVIEPCISTRWSPRRARNYLAKSPGRSVTISTPVGYNYLYDMFNRHEYDSAWKSYHFDYTTSPFLDPEEIARIKRTVDPLKFAREYLASFKDSGNNVFYCFDRGLHVRHDIPYFTPASSASARDGEVVHCAIDFNVGIQATSIWAIRGSQAFCLDEFKGHPDTASLANTLKSRFLDKGHRVYVYPDPSGKSRKTSAPVGVTDFTILQQAGLTVLAKRSAPPIVDSVACVNRMLQNANGDVNTFVSSKCVGTITSLERTAWVERNPDLATIDKSEGIEHFSDGIRYLFDYAFPVTGASAIAKKGKSF